MARKKVKKTKARKKPVKKNPKKEQESDKEQPTTIMGMAYKDFRGYKKRTGLG
jgi:hypothetical protein